MRPRRLLGLVAVAVLLPACGGGHRPVAPTRGAPTVSAPTGAASSGSPPVTVPSGAPASVRLVPIATLEEPLALAVRRGDPALYVAEKSGKVVAVHDGHPDPSLALDISGKVSEGGEQGLLGIAFSPDGSKLYADYTDANGDTHVAEFPFADGRADASRERTVLFVRQPYPNHNGGELVFDRDGDLYVGLGDGGGGGDPQDNGQSLRTLLGKILRIDPAPGGRTPYTVPPDNPFVHTAGARPEIWAYGLRNPWRFSFDRATGDLWIGDVGQNAYEEVDFVPARSAAGSNFEWSLREGSHRYKGAEPKDGTPPVYDYSHTTGGCVVTGGYVYRGRAIRSLIGTYVFADYCMDRLMSLRRSGSGSGSSFAEVDLGPAPRGISSFGEDANGELYALALSGEMYRLEP